MCSSREALAVTVPSLGGRRSSDARTQGAWRALHASDRGRSSAQRRRSPQPSLARPSVRYWRLFVSGEGRRQTHLPGAGHSVMQGRICRREWPLRRTACRSTNRAPMGRRALRPPPRLLFDLMIPVFDTTQEDLVGCCPRCISSCEHSCRPPTAKRRGRQKGVHACFSIWF